MEKERETELNKWKLKSTKKVYDNPWITVEHDEVITPTGTDGVYGRVHFKNKAIAIIPIDTDLNTWIVGQYRYTLKEYSWELPMGGGPVGEDILASAQRELQEETGILASQWTQILRLHTSNCVCDEEAFVYVAEGLSFGETSFDETEDLKIKRIPFADLVQMCLDGRITDAITVAGVLAYERILAS